MMYVCTIASDNYVIVLIKVIQSNSRPQPIWIKMSLTRLSSSPAVTVITVAGKDVHSSSKQQPDILARPDPSTASVPVIAAQPPCFYVPVAPAPFDDHTFGPKVCV